MRDAAASLKQVTLELGGKSPIIVFEDAALDNAWQARCSQFSTRPVKCAPRTAFSSSEVSWRDSWSVSWRATGAADRRSVDRPPRSVR